MRKTPAVLLLSLIGGVQTLDLPGDFDEVILLQRSFKPTTISQEPLELTQDNMAEKLQSIQEYLQNQPDGDAAGSDGEEGDLQSMKTMLENQMEAYLLVLHETAKADWTTSTTQATTCGDAKGRRFDNTTGDVVVSGRAAHQARLKHHACRRSQKAWNTFRTMGYTAPADLAVHTVDPPAIAFMEAVSKSQTLAQAYNGLAPIGKHDCLVDQTTFEMAYCIWAAKARETCNAFSSCISGLGLTDLRNRLLVDAAARRSMWTTIGILKCQIDQMSGDSTAAADDTAATVNCTEISVNTTHLVLELTIPTLNDCTDDQLPPLSSPNADDSADCATWISTEYGWDSSDAVIPDTCATTCLGAHPPISPPGCEDTQDQCTFYANHPSACGSFQTDGSNFNACNDCCYCKFSPACGKCPPNFIVHQGGTACQECPDGKVSTDSATCVDPVPPGIPKGALLFLVPAGSPDTGASYNSNKAIAIQTDNTDQYWRLPMAADNCENTGCLGNNNAWNKEGKLLSGQVVSWHNPASNRVLDCAWGGCSRQPFPPPGGHWGTPYRIWKIVENGGTRTKAAEGTPVSHDDNVIFERMFHGSWNSKYLTLCDPNCRGIQEVYSGSLSHEMIIKMVAPP